MPETASKSGKITYSLQPHKAGRSTFSDVKLPSGETIRRVDQSVHQRALDNASRLYKEKAE